MNFASPVGPDHVQMSLFIITTCQNNTFSHSHFETKTSRWRSNLPEEKSTVVTEGWLGSGKASVEGGWSSRLAEQHKAQPCRHTRHGMEHTLGRTRHGEQLSR